jgi:hypothetical protein
VSAAETVYSNTRLTDTEMMRLLDFLPAAGTAAPTPIPFNPVNPVYFSEMSVLRDSSCF